MQFALDLRCSAPRKLAWDFHYLHHTAGRPHTYCKYRCSRRSHGVRVKRKLIRLEFFFFSLSPSLTCTRYPFQSDVTSLLLCNNCFFGFDRRRSLRYRNCSLSVEVGHCNLLFVLYNRDPQERNRCASPAENFDHDALTARPIFESEAISRQIPAPVF